MRIKVFWLHGERFEKKIEEINEWAKNKDIKQITVAAGDVVFIQYDEIIDSEKETEKEKAASLGKFTSHEIADKWRQLTASDIISSIDIGLSVLEGKEFSISEKAGKIERFIIRLKRIQGRGENEILGEEKVKC